MTKIKTVEQFWSSNPCNSRLSTSDDRQRYFLEIAQERYKHEPHIPEIARFEDFYGKRVLEIGCGVGTDGRHFSFCGADYVGINLDAGSTELAREGFRVGGYAGRIEQMNAEEMTFREEFDHIYSFGVLHHSPRPESIAANMYHALKVGGTFTVMLYNRSSINYRLEIMVLRKLFRYALYPSWSPALVSKLGLNRDKLEHHRKIMLAGGMTHDRWVSINTDGPDCPLARVYSAREACRLFSDAGFSKLRTYSRFFDARHYGKLSRLIPGFAVRFLGNRFGWHRIVEGSKTHPPA